MSLKSVLCISFCRLTSLSCFQLNLLITNILADCHQLILLLSECLALTQKPPSCSLPRTEGHPCPTGWTSPGGITLAFFKEYFPRKQQTCLVESLTILSVCSSYSQAVRVFAALKIVSPSEASCINV